MSGFDLLGIAQIVVWVSSLVTAAAAVSIALSLRKIANKDK